MSICTEYLELLFNKGEHAGFGHTPYTTRSYNAFEPPRNAVFVTLNPLAGGTDRRDANVTAYRNFLVEMDEDTTSGQMQYIDTLEMPYSVAVYSGKKSVHFIICLEETLSEPEWRAYAKAILQVARRADPSTKNPSRYTRLGGALRPETNQVQAVWNLRERISREQLDKWLAEHEVVARPVIQHFFFTNGRRRVTLKRINRHTRFFLLHGAEEGNRNNAAFQAAVNLLECGYNTDHVRERFAPLVGRGYTEHEFEKIIGFAVNRVKSAR